MKPAPVDASKILNIEWDDFIEEYPDFDHQDIFYLFTAYQAIDKWFNTSKVDSAEFTKKLLNHVRLIANSISDDSKEEKIFGNLNSKEFH